MIDLNSFAVGFVTGITAAALLATVVFLKYSGERDDTPKGTSSLEK